MKLESLKLEKFKSNALKKEQMFMLNGGGSKTEAGTHCGEHGPKGKFMEYDYGYDVLRGVDSSGMSYITYHNRSNVRDSCEQNSSYN
ncbi:MAG TPA: hypothetical protein DCS19_12225 [Flavobacterium sp.]|nr:hypothetical protein [Flavobacterium sp.]